MEAHIDLKASERMLLKWHDVLLAFVKSEGPHLTSRQMTVLTFISLHPAPQTVSGLAMQLEVGKPTICRALDRLSRLRLVKRRADLNDRRSVRLRTTAAGWVFLDRVAEQLTSSFGFQKL